jgi:hypothetical protein
VTTHPIAHQFPGCCGRNIPRTKLAVKSERCLLALKFNVKVWRIMISEIHSDDDSEERRNDWHESFLADSGIHA